MLYFKLNQSNDIVVTFTERSQSEAAPFYLLVLTHIETLIDTLIVLPKSANLSLYTERYDKFTISNLFTNGGQYRYVAHESNTTALSGSIGIVETGLAMVQTNQEAYISDGGATRYVAFGNETAVVISPNGGVVSDVQEITLTTTTSGASIYYTIDGTDPTISSLLYNPASKPVLAASATFKARGFKAGTTPTAINTVSFIVVSADAALFLDAAGITDPTITAAINTFVLGLQADGIWKRMFALYPMVGGTASAHKFNLKDPRDLDAAYRLTFAGPFIHSALGVQPDSTGQPANIVAYANANTFFRAEMINDFDGLSYGFDARTPIVFRGIQPTLIGSTSTQINAIDTVEDEGADTRYFINEKDPFVVYSTFAANDNQLFLQCSRNRATGVFKFAEFDNSIATGTNVEAPATIDGLNLFLFASNLSGNRQNGSQSEQRCAFAYIGNDLTTLQMTNLRDRYFTMRTALGR